MSGLVVRNAEVRIGGVGIVRAASFSAPAGTVTALLGPNGSGKSTLLSTVLGLRRLHSGSIAFEGSDLLAVSPQERARRCAYVEQFSTTSERLTVRDVAGLGRIPFQSAWQSGPAAEDAAIIETALRDVGMLAFAARLYHSLSGGEQQRVQIARALAQQPRLLLLDEATSHLDIQAQLLILAMLQRLAGNGCTIVLALHDLNLASRFCDHLVVLGRGRVVTEGAPADVLNAPLLREVYGVEASVTTAPGYPLVLYDRALPGGALPNPIDNSAPPAKL